MMLALERDKDLEASEKQRLEEEILAKAEEIQQMQTDVDEKEQETLRLQEEINEANLQMQVPDLDKIKLARICHDYHKMLPTLCKFKTSFQSCRKPTLRFKWQVLSKPILQMATY